MTTPKTGDTQFFYGGAAGLKVGDQVPTELAPLPASRAVRLSLNLEQARAEAHLQNGDGDVYEVKPLGDRIPPQRRIAYPATYPAAEVVRVLERGLRGPAASGPMAGASSSMAEDAEVSMHEREAPIVGFRKWQLCGAPMDGLLAVPLEGGHAQPKWQPGENRALCRYDHPPVSSDCASGCGIPAYHSSEDPALFSREGLGAENRITNDAIYAALLGWGRVLTDGRLWRVQYGELAALWVDPASDRHLIEALKHEPVDPATDGVWAPRLASRLEVPLLNRREELVEAAEAAVKERSIARRGR